MRGKNPWNANLGSACKKMTCKYLPVVWQMVVYRGDFWHGENMKEFCSKAVQMRVSAHSGAEEEELLKAATSSLPKAQEHLATLFAGLNQSLIPPEYWGLTSTIQEKSSAHCTNTTQHIHSHGRIKTKEPHTWIPFLGKIIGTLSIPSAVLLEADFRSKLE